MIAKLWRGVAAAAWALSVVGTNAADFVLRTSAQESAEPRFIVPAPGSSAPVTGMCIDFMRAIERADSGIRFTGELTPMPLKRVDAEMRSGLLDLAFCLVKNPERDPLYLFIEPPLYRVDYVLAARADDPVQIQNWSDVAKLGPQAVVLFNWGSGLAPRIKTFHPEISVDDRARDAQSNLKKLVHGRGRYFYYRAPTLKAEIGRLGLDDRVKLIFPPMETAIVHIMVARHVPPQAIERLSRAVARLQASGELARIVEKWGN